MLDGAVPLIRRKVAEVFKPLHEPKTYKGAYGGRGSGKSHFFAEELVLRCFAKPLRAVCIREVQLTLADSVHQLLVDKIGKFNLGPYFTITDRYISSYVGAYIIFRGMQTMNASNIKSLEGFDLAWVEEAQMLSQHSLDMLYPTIRKENAELWFSWNPQFRTDAVDVFFRKNKDADRKTVVRVNWSENPWFPEKLRRDMEMDRREDSERAEHIWDGAYGALHGSILARLVDRAERAGRINDKVEFDREGPPIEISCDLGRTDTSTWWFWQRRVDGFAVLDVDSDAGLHADEWSQRLWKRLNEHGWPLGKLWLPHDAKQKSLSAHYTAREQFAKAFEWKHTGLVPRSTTVDRINAGRTVVPKCWFHATRCEKGLDGLRAWQYAYDEETKAYSKEPVHDWACFVAGTMVDTPSGQRPIESLRAGETVTTPAGPRALEAVYRHRTARLVEIETADGRRVLSTPNHKFFTARGLIAADGLYYGDRLFTGRERLWRAISWISEVGGITGIHQAITTSCQPKSIGAKGCGIGNCTAISMPPSMGQSLMATRYTTGTRTKATTTSKTWSYCRSLHTRSSTALRAAANLLLGIAPGMGAGFTRNLPSAAGGMTARLCLQTASPLSTPLAKPRAHGTEATRAESGTASTVSEFGSIAPRSRRFARFAIRLLLRIGRARNTAGRIVALRAFDADTLVYDLNVERDHCFVANGILVSNSHFGDGFTYGCQVMESLPPPEEEAPPPPAPVSEPMTITQLMEARPKPSGRIA